MKLLVCLGLKLACWICIVFAIGLWLGAGVDTRPKYRDVQTLIGGTLWSQIIVQLGLMMSYVAKEKMNSFINAYYLVTGIMCCVTTSAVLIAEELKRIKRMKRQNQVHAGERRFSLLWSQRETSYKRPYMAIGISCLFAGTFLILELVCLLVPLGLD